MEHFSRYGLLDEDSDENVEADGVVPRNAPSSSHKKVLNFKEASMEEDADASIFQDSILHTSGKPGRVHFHLSEKIEEDSEELYEDEREKDILEDEYEGDYTSGEYDSITDEEQETIDEHDFDEEEEILSEESNEENHPFESTMIVDRPAELKKKEMARRVQGMKVANMFASTEEKKPVHVVSREASYFGSAPLEFNIEDFKDSKKSSASVKRADTSPNESSTTIKRTDFSMTSSSEPGLVSPRKYFKSKSTVMKGVPYEKSVTFKKETQLVDSGLFMGKSFRVGWAPGGVFIVNNG